MEVLEVPAAVAARCDVLGLAFLARFYEVELDRRPENLEALMELGHVYTKLGRYAEGLAVDHRIVRACPKDATAHYNLACSLALTGDSDGAFGALELAVELGYGDLELLNTDADLEPLRSDPRFGPLVARIAAKPE